MSRFLDRAAERLLDRLRLKVKAHATSSDAGGHRSSALNQGLEFADHRQYVPRDRVRVIPFATEIAKTSRVFRSRAQIPELEKFLAEASAEGVTTFEQTVRSFAARHSMRGMVVVVSDLMATE